jgi:hypothetical protein
MFFANINFPSTSLNALYKIFLLSSNVCLIKGYLVLVIQTVYFIAGALPSCYNTKYQKRRCRLGPQYSQLSHPIEHQKRDTGYKATLTPCAFECSILEKVKYSSFVDPMLLLHNQGRMSWVMETKEETLKIGADS